MAFTQTNNFGLNKDDGTEFYDVEKINENTDIIDTVLGNTAKYEKAGGTSTAIILTGVILEDGISKTFIASANNGGAATTINAKSLYKPGTTTVPNLIAGKAYTVWYDLTGDCFFLKASAEGDAVAANVLAGKKFSNDSDTGIEGEMPDNGAVVITPGTTDKPITKGYHDGNGYVQGDADLISSNIKAGANIFGVPGSPMVMDTSVGDAVAGNILAGKKACVGGAVVTGTMPVKTVSEPAFSYDATSVADRIYIRPAEGYYDGVSAGATVQLIDANFNSENIKAGVSIFGKLGAMSAGKKYASGVVHAATSQTLPFYFPNETAIDFPYITVSGLSFTASAIFVMSNSYGNYFTVLYPISLNPVSASPPRILLGSYDTLSNRNITISSFQLKEPAYSRPGTFQLPVQVGGYDYTWYAFE